MPEKYIDPSTDVDRLRCYVCDKIAMTAFLPELLKCPRCHTISYCSKECQEEDWPRHKWNCIPVMVTEIPGKGRGLVAAKNFKKGDLIFTDTASIKIPMDQLGDQAGPSTLESLRKQKKKPT